ncbi:hypothetical protein Bca52824_047661 [Brassica carinata]|uniref:Uncharacterized protein n=1 Tax=Brassica carinata TaxID=52824 RepID=A0A8X7RHP2_BRACI|nr:hypothetical protein Bca52824_047661 [Brassica carinata]
MNTHWIVAVEWELRPKRLICRSLKHFVAGLSELADMYEKSKLVEEEHLRVQRKLWIDLF